MPAQPTSTPAPDMQEAQWPPRVSAATLAELERHVTKTEAPHDRAPVHAPYTGARIASLPLCTEADVDLAVRRARTAQAAWARRPLAERVRVATRLHDLVLEQQDEILDLIQLESGKARRDAFEEVADVALVARYYAYHAGRHLKPRRRRSAAPLLMRTDEIRHPYGVVGIIAPWNYPFTLAVTDAIPALLAGNAVVLKPAELTTYAALRGARLFQEAGLPEDLFHVVTGRGRTLGTPLIDRVDFIGFTGSTEVGRLIGRQAGERLIPCSLELGGKNAMLVLHDADLDAAVEGAVRGCFSNAGQLCISFERIYVARPRFDAFVDRFADRTRSLAAAATYDYSADVGCLSSREQYDKVVAHVEDARAKGATIVAGGRPVPEAGPLFYAPTLVTDVTEDVRLACEETFGPVVALYPFDDEDEAVARANGTSYGLNASVWTRDHRRGRALARRLEAGTVGVNSSYQATWGSVDAPMGGFKDSGLGRRHGAPGIQKYTQLQNVTLNRGLPLDAPPGIADGRFAAFMTGLLRTVRRLPGLR